MITSRSSTLAFFSLLGELGTAAADAAGDSILVFFELFGELGGFSLSRFFFFFSLSLSFSLSFLSFLSFFSLSDFLRRGGFSLGSPLGVAVTVARKKRNCSVVFIARR